MDGLGKIQVARNLEVAEEERGTGFTSRVLCIEHSRKMNSHLFATLLSSATDYVPNAQNHFGNFAFSAKLPLSWVYKATQ
jgi:hypothetical protein